MENINICFSFDKNYIAQAKTTIGSLLDASTAKNVHYNIYLICPKEVKEYEENITKFLKNKDNKSTIHFHYHNESFNNGFQIREISKEGEFTLMAILSTIIRHFT